MSFYLPFTDIRARVSLWFFLTAGVALQLGEPRLLWYMLAPIIIHETGHIIAILGCKARLVEIYITPIGIKLITRGDILPLGKDIIVALGGIAANLLVAGYLRFFEFQSMRVMMMVSTNLLVAAFNALPVGNLDGGRVVSLICSRYLEPSSSRVVGNVISFVLLAPLSAFAGLLVLGSGNFSLAIICVYLAVVVVLS